jgi:hypothetical protein
MLLMEINWQIQPRQGSKVYQFPHQQQLRLQLVRLPLKEVSECLQPSTQIILFLIVGYLLIANTKQNFLVSPV